MEQTTQITVVVTRRIEMAPRVVELTLEQAAGGDLPAWQPGAHIDMTLPNGLTRQYSLCGDQKRNDSWRIAVLREVDGRGGSEYVHTALHEGATVSVKGPRNHFPLEPADEYLFVGGGIGITPLLPMIEAVAADGKPWRLVYGGRSRETMPYLQQLQSSFPRQVTPHPQDEMGLIDLTTVLGDVQKGRAVYACGPAPMLAAIQTHCEAWPSGSVRMEAFTPLAATVTSSDTLFEVTVASTDEAYSVPVDKTILEVLREADVAVDWSCEEGTCGTCETRVLEGTPDHRDFVLTDEEKASQETMILCVSRAKSAKLVLDL